MKADVIQMLHFPRELARGSLDLEDCSHGGNYAARDPKCLTCEARLECQWLYHNDEFSSLEQQPLDKIIEALGFASSYVDARITLSGHRRPCHCEACLWLRDANALLARVQESF